MATFFSLFILSTLIILLPFSSSKFHDTLSKGSSLSVENPNHVLISPEGIFSAGFYAVGKNAYCFAIWFTNPSCPNNCSVVWMANRDVPINGRRSKLSLLKTGNLILTDAGQSIIWASNTLSPSSLSLNLSDYGNLVLITTEGVILWQSFDSPTDTLLPWQPLTRNTRLVSSRSQANFSSGFYKFYFDDDNVLRLVYDGPVVSSVFWPDHWLLSRDAGRSSYNSSRLASLDSSGKFTSSDNFSFFSADYGENLQRRLSLDYDGLLRLYSRKNWRESWFISWEAFSHTCKIHGACGPNSVCQYVPSFGRKCSCLPGFKIKNHTDFSLGCEPELRVSCEKSDEVTFLHLTHLEMYGYDFGYLVNYTLDMCREVCLKRCDCKGFVLKYYYQNYPDNIYPFCFPKTQLLNGYRSPHFHGELYLKVPMTSSFSRSWAFDDMNLECPANVIEQLDRKYAKNHGNGPVKFFLWFVIAVGLVEILGIFLVWLFFIRRRKSREATTQGNLNAATGFKRFTYAELKKSTKNFREEIGRGASGIVYKGILQDNRVAAIKRLNEANEGDAAFLAEVSTIGKLNHMNLLEMWGYAAEGKHRLLVYEYMEHGSLAINLASKTLDWKRRFEIALGTAKGLAYLHEECLEWVLHCDVKPQNILLDYNYQPKVSDFGLSRLLSRGELKNSCFSRIRGTRGYMAPEWVFKLPITSKVDVYSYGIVVLELLTGKNPSMEVHNTVDSNEVDHRKLVEWIREKKNEDTGMPSWVQEIVDPNMGREYDMKTLATLVEVALQCVKEDRGSRPTMSQVIEMLLHNENDD